MAKQNFIAGGYYGKLGETVGQRWKNIRTIRVYVIPHDPRTPAQLACRSVFRDGVPYAQQGMRINKGAPCWNYENKTEWQARVGTAVDRLRGGVTGDAVIPIFPDGYTPEVVVNDVYFASLGGGLYMFSSLSAPAISEEREIMVCVECTQGGGTETVDVYAMVMLQAGEGATFQVDLGGYSPKDGGRIFGVTVDDATHSGKMVYIAIQQIQSAPVVQVADWAFSGWNTNSVEFDSTQLSQVTRSHSLLLAFKMFNPFTGLYVDIEVTGNAVPGQTDTSFELDNDFVTFFGSSTIKGRSASSFIDNGKVYQFPEIPVVASRARNVESTAWPQLPTVSLLVERDVDNGNTLFTIDIIYPFELPDGGLNVAQGEVPQVFGATGYVGGTETTKNVWYDTPEVDNSGGHTHLTVTATLGGTLFDEGTLCRIATTQPSITVQGVKALSGITSASATVQDA